MKIGILGTGIVGKTIGTKLAQLNHEVMMGSRSASNEKAIEWVKNSGAKVSNGIFEDAAKFGEIIFNCTSGMVSLEALKLAGEENLKGKILVDISNALDFSKGMPPTLSVVNTTSIGEEIQKAYPETKVVKTLNTLNAALMTNPASVNNGDHTVFLNGNDADAKAEVRKILNSFDWKDENIIDLGDITTARGTEQLLPIWVRLMMTFNSPMFQFKIVK